jgi:hypothetical protein
LARPLQNPRRFISRIKAAPGRNDGLGPIGQRRPNSRKRRLRIYQAKVPSNERGKGGPLEQQVHEDH